MHPILDGRNAAVRVSSPTLNSSTVADGHAITSASIHGGDHGFAPHPVDAPAAPLPHGPAPLPAGLSQPRRSANHRLGPQDGSAPPPAPPQPGGRPQGPIVPPGSKLAQHPKVKAHAQQQQQRARPTPWRRPNEDRDEL